MAHRLVENGYIPLDKSWIIRMGVLDLVHGCDDSVRFLKEQNELGEDLKALLRASLSWKTGVVDVGESGTLYRFLKFASWKLGEPKKFILHGTLKRRKICNNPGIASCSLEELLKLDNGTSQWASASVLMGSKEKVENPPHKLKLTYEAVPHWKERRARGLRWIPRYDETILRQAEACLRLLKGRKMKFKPVQAEDYCFARAFGLITPEEGEKRWSSLRGHETDRIAEMERVIGIIDSGKEIISKDHRVLQAAAMCQKVRGTPVTIKDFEPVKKSWPQFEKFLEDSPILAGGV